MMEKVVSRLGFVILGLVLSILMLEIGFRVFYTHLPYPLQYQASGVRQWGITGAPMGLRINSNDFYKTCVGDDWLFAKPLAGLKNVQVMAGPENTFHITTHDLGFDSIGFRTVEGTGPWDGVVVGDSFSFCTGVEAEECWVHLVSMQLGLRLANLGVNGTGSVSHQRYLDQYGWALKPKFVLWQFYVNDPRDDYFHIVSGFQGCPRPEPAQASTPPPLGNVRHFLSRTFVTYTLLVSPLLRRFFPQRATPKSQASDYKQIRTSDGHELYLQEYAYEPRSPEWSEGMKLTKQAIVAAKQAAEARGIPLLMVLVPANYQVYEDLLPTEKLTEMARSWDVAMDDMAAFLRDQEIETIDLRPVLHEAVVRGEDIYPAYDVHWNAKGNRLVADVISDWLATQLGGSGGGASTQ